MLLETVVREFDDAFRCEQQIFKSQIAVAETVLIQTGKTVHNLVNILLDDSFRKDNKLKFTVDGAVVNKLLNYDEIVVFKCVTKYTVNILVLEVKLRFEPQIH